MKDTEVALARIEAILHDIEKLDMQTNGQFRDEYDQEATDIVTRILKKLRRKQKAKCP
jgi:hypothetical protein